MTTRADSFSRTAKIFADSAEAVTLDDADAILDTYCLQVHVGDVSDNIALQAAVLTIVNNAAGRSFRGGVDVHLTRDCVLGTGWFYGKPLSLAVAAFGGTLVTNLTADHPTICVGEPGAGVPGRVVLRAVTSGWIAGVVEGSESPLPETDPFVLAGVAAGGIAVAEAFEWRRGRNLLAGRRSQGVSLWRPGSPWLSDEAHGPNDVTYAPAAWWLVGLGHLGQGYLWAIGMLPYRDPSEVKVLLNDDDDVSEANESTGLLLVPGEVADGLPTRKTRLLGPRLEGRGFRTTISERRLAAGDGPRGNEPRLALIGVDNLHTRRALSDTVGFELIVDGGLGGGPFEYLDIAIHTFPASRTSSDIPSWREVGSAAEPPVHQPAYDDLTEKTGDPCGTVEVAGRSVAACFVGATAGALVVAEALRALRGEPRHEVLSVSLRDLDGAGAVVAAVPPMGNVGYADLA